jgi:hypothetical protein
VIHVRMNRPDKREVGSSILPRPMKQNLDPAYERVRKRGLC